MVLSYLKGFLYFLCSCYGEWFMVYSWLFMKYIFRSGIWFLTIGIRALSLAKEGKICFLFVQKIFFWKKKRATHFRFRYKILRDEFGKTNWVFEFLSEKYPISKKK
jgi:hypothetical protein